MHVDHRGPDRGRLPDHGHVAFAIALSNRLDQLREFVAVLFSEAMLRVR